MNLLLQRLHVLEFPLNSDGQQLVVGNTTPKEKRQARRQFDVIEAISSTGSGADGIAFDAKEELRGNEKSLKRHFDPGLEPPSFPPLLVESDQRGDVLIGHRPPIRATC